MPQSSDQAPSWPEVCAVLARWQSANLPGTTTLEVGLKLTTGTVLPMPFVVCTGAASAPVPPPATSQSAPEDDWKPFVPTPFQKAILKALEGKAMHTRALGIAVGDKGRLYKPGGIKELEERGLVEQHDRLGYYRPDVPPPEILQADDPAKPT